MRALFRQALILLSVVGIVAGPVYAVTSSSVQYHVNVTVQGSELAVVGSPNIAVMLRPGASQTFTTEVQNVTGNDVTFTWYSDNPPGISPTLATTTYDYALGPGETLLQTWTLDVDPNIVPGEYAFDLTASVPGAAGG